MNFVSSLKPVAALVLALAAGFANATTVTFTTQPAFLQTHWNDTADSFMFTSSPTVARFGGLNLTGTTLDELGLSTLTVTSSKGAFDLDSLSLDGLLNLHFNTTSVYLAYTEGNGTTGKETLVLDGKSGFQTFSSALGKLDDLTSFKLSSVTGFALDNLVTTAYVAPTAAVPEPANAALMLSALGLLGFVARRRAK